MNVLTSLFDVVFPPLCIACDSVLHAPGYFCGACEPLVLEIGPVFCQRCAEPGLFPNQTCPRCRRDRPSFRRAFAPFEHEGALARAIHRFKYEDRPELVRDLGKLWISHSQDFLRGAPTTVCPVPLHVRRYRERRYDQAMLLAHELCSLDTRFQLEPALLTRVKETSRQVGLSDSERLENLTGAFEANGTVERVLLIDDVMTTGATVNAAAEALIQAGCRHIEAFTLCRARRIFTA